MWISSMSTLLMVGGVVLVLCALPPVRRMAAAALDRVESAVVPRRKPVEAAPAAAETTPDGIPVPEVRREIEEFDLSLFDS
jgi:hypothetical protein